MSRNAYFYYQPARIESVLLKETAEIENSGYFTKPASSVIIRALSLALLSAVAERPQLQDGV